MTPSRLSIALGRTPRTEAVFRGAVASAGLALDFADIKPISRAFAPMVREGRYEASEMAIATFLMAKAAGKDLVLLPVVLAARFQEAALLCREEAPIRGPADLAGRRIGVRAYSQTTGLWLRGAIAEAAGLAAEAMQWVTFEEAHVAEYRDPPWVERAGTGADMLAMLRDGRLDAAIFGNDMPDAAGLRTVFPNAEAAGAAFQSRHGFVPVNHLLTVRGDVARNRKEDVAELVRMLGASGAGVTDRATLGPAIACAIRYAVAQRLLAAPLSHDAVWSDAPPAG